jgi:hypothetical protein
LCSAEVGTGITATGVPDTPGCNNNWQAWGIGSRTQWDVTKTFYLGVEVLYSGMQSAQTPTGFVSAANAIAGPIGPVRVANESNWSATIRAHRDFLP